MTSSDIATLLNHPPPLIGHRHSLSTHMYQHEQVRLIRTLKVYELYDVVED
jgi:hypothetical protein